MATQQILLIDSDRKRQQTLLAIFQFVGKACVACSSDNWQKQSGEISAIFIVVEQTLNATKSLIDDVHKQWPKLPLIILYDGSVPFAKLSQIKNDRILNLLSLPLEHTQVIDVLHQCQVYQQKDSNVLVDVKPDLTLFRSLAGDSHLIKQVKKLMQQVYEQDVTVLILGESGTGKEVVARSLHYQSQRRDKPFIAVNCGAIPAELLESELFGHEKGAFTGAVGARKGRFELAQGGTLFLDEIGDMPINMQVKLLRVLQERCFERVGGNKNIPIDIRIIAATHRNLPKLIAENTFREDLFYRLNVFPINMPALRERAQDIPTLIDELLVRLQAQGRRSIALSEAAIKTLCDYAWPGNVRELANLIERLTILYPETTVDVAQLPEPFCSSSSSTTLLTDNLSASDVSSHNQTMLSVDGIDLKAHIQAIEKDFIHQALTRTDGVVTQAAELLKLRRTTLVEKIRKYDLQSADLSQTSAT